MQMESKKLCRHENLTTVAITGKNKGKIYVVAVDQKAI